jgi:hypothetical protein
MWARASQAVLVTAIAVLAASCGGGGDGGGDVESCTVSENAGSFGLLQVCVEGPPSAFASGCQSTGTPVGDASIDVHITAAPCSHAGALGACQYTNAGVTESVWYYGDGVDAGDGVGPMPSDIQTLCKDAGAKYIAP